MGGHRQSTYRTVPNHVLLRVSSRARQDIIYLDDDIVIANKPSGLLCVPGRIEKDSLATRFESTESMAWKAHIHIPVFCCECISMLHVIYPQSVGGVEASERGEVRGPCP